MTNETKPNILIISSFFKGNDFINTAAEQGATVFLITSKKIEHSAKWPIHAIKDIFYVNDVNNEQGNWNMEDVIAGIAWLMQSTKIDIVAALDDFDVEKAAHVREHFRIDGMGQTTSRYFRDKLAMRTKAKSDNIECPEFTPIFNDNEVEEYTNKVHQPWMLKPRSEASATGIKKINSKIELWESIKKLEGRRHNFLLEQFRPGDVYHVDSLSMHNKIIFSRVSRYLSTPMEVAHGGGVFRSIVVGFGSDDDRALLNFNDKVLHSFGMQFSASHSEYIKNKETGKFYFLETSSRVGGAHLAEMVEYSSGINLWVEWAKIEIAMFLNKPYKLPKINNDYAGIIVSLSKHQWASYKEFDDKEIVWKLDKEYHVGLIVKAKTEKKVMELLDKYLYIIKENYHASMPSPDKPTS
jgi:biotin carboxylase